MLPEARTLRLIEKNEVAPDHFELVFPLTDALSRTTPGQFVNILCRDDATSDPLLRRPLSVYSVDGDRFSVLFHVVGRGTELMSRLRPGQWVDVLGPLGRGFDLDGVMRGDQLLLVGGGVGTPPLFYLSQRLRDMEIDHDIVLGFTTKDRVISVDRWQEMGMSPIVVTDDGSSGRKGLVTDPLFNMVKTTPPDAVMTCGPRPMLAAVAEICGESSIPCQVAMEEWMGCGVGVCLSCVHPVLSVGDRGGAQEPDGELARICYEGPVFDGAKVVWT